MYSYKELSGKKKEEGGGGGGGGTKNKISSKSQLTGKQALNLMEFSP